MRKTAVQPRCSGISPLPDYELRVIAPLGQGTYILKGTRDGVDYAGSLTINSQWPRTAEQLLYEATRLEDFISMD